MTKKRSIHELIEEQEPEAKQRMWEEVRQRIAQEDILGEAPTRKKFSWKKFATIAASFVLVLGISLFSVFILCPKRNLKVDIVRKTTTLCNPLKKLLSNILKVCKKIGYILIGMNMRKVLLM